MICVIELRTTENLGPALFITLVQDCANIGRQHSVAEVLR